MPWQEISGCPKTNAADGGAQPSTLTGGTPFRQLGPAYPSTGGRWRGVRFSEELPTSLRLGMCILTAQLHLHRRYREKRAKRDRYRQARFNSRNRSNITTLLRSVNRRNVHLTSKAIRLRSNCAGLRNRNLLQHTSSSGMPRAVTVWVASRGISAQPHLSFRSLSARPEQLNGEKLSNGPVKRLNLMKKCSASTLSSFQQRMTRPGVDRGAGRVHG
jgi:hypothetical protein